MARTVAAMTVHTSTLGGERHRFDSLARLLAAASPERSGDRLAGLAADSARQRVAARWALAEVPLADGRTRSPAATTPCW